MPRYVCRNCGSADGIHTVEEVLRSCYITIEDPAAGAEADDEPEYDFTGNDEIHYDTSTTTGYECDCSPGTTFESLSKLVKVAD